MRIQTIILATIIGVFMLSGQGIASANDPVDDMKYRKGTMKAIGGHMGSIVASVKGKAGTDAQLIAHAKSLSLMGSVMSGLFQEGSNLEKSTALPDIWSKPEEFKVVITAFEDAVATLGMAADAGDVNGIKASLGGIGKSCKGCHSNFRKKK